MELSAEERLQRRVEVIIQVSNHKEASNRIPSKEADASWTTVFAGVMTITQAHERVESLAKNYTAVRAFKEGTIGKPFYASYRKED